MATTCAAGLPSCDPWWILQVLGCRLFHLYDLVGLAQEGGPCGRGRPRHGRQEGVQGHVEYSKTAE
jgi:hypothetical protein